MNAARSLCVLALGSLLAACGPVENNNPDGSSSGLDGSSPAPDGSSSTPDSATMPPMDSGVSPVDSGVAPPTDSGTISMPDAAAMGRIDISTPAPGNPATRTQAEVCAAWNSATSRARMAGSFTAGAMMCAPGMLPQSAVDAAVLMTNAYRYLAGLANIAENADETRAAQACAELMEANRMLSHMPPNTWTCYTALGAMGAARSNITSGGSSPMASLAGWVDDSRDISGTLGHRRWILFPQLGPIGYGQARSYACQYVLGPRGSGRKDWVAWPNEGFTPMAAMSQIWSFSSASAGVTAMTRAAVTLNGTAVPVMAQLRANGYGDPTISWNMPAITAGGTYHVTITGLNGGAMVEYDVRPVACN
ncbi:MAG: CAP domain-containing protein [Polyangiales bacterium]